MVSSKKTRILVIDDNADIRELLQIVLEQAGYEVALASHGGEGLERQRAAPCELVITDIFMPQQDGIETIDRLRKEYPDTKIIAMSGGGRVVTGNTGVDYLGTAREFGASRLLRKPFDIEALLEAVREVSGSVR
jgi:CheY-like chemotaxis protein